MVVIYSAIIRANAKNKCADKVYLVLFTSRLAHCRDVLLADVRPEDETWGIVGELQSRSRLSKAAQLALDTLGNS